MIVTRHRTIFFTLTSIIVALSIAAIAIFGLHLSIDFTGGTRADISYQNGRPAAQQVERALTGAGFTDYSLREEGANDYTLRTQNLTDAQRGSLEQLFTVDASNPATVASLDEIGPTIGAELRNKSILAMSLVIFCILLFIAFAFRKVSKPVSSWVYGLIALVTLVHDVIVPVGFFALLGHLTGAQVDTLFVTAVLTVLGFSIHDTIVVFDRVRENLRVNHEFNRREDFAETAGRSLNQTFVRSINTSMTVVFTLLVLYFIGPSSTQVFALTLLVGIVAGTYSSIFLATPLLVEVEARRRGLQK